jgi:exosortase/archaeosortase family protein
MTTANKSPLAITHDSHGSPVLPAVVKGMVLLALYVWAFRPELRTIFYALAKSQEGLTIALPLALVVLIVLRAPLFRVGLTKGSWAGVALTMAGIGWYALATWPVNYALLRLVALPIILAGLVLTVAGGRVFKHSMPLLMILALALPIGPRLYAAVIIKPETATLHLTRVVLDRLPGVEVWLRGSDLLYMYGGSPGAIALGEPYRGMDLLGAYTLIGVFVVFARVRPFWQIVMAVIAAGPIILLANFIRILTWGLVTIYGRAGPTSEFPRDLAIAASLLMAYGTFGLWCFILSRLVIEEDESSETGEPTEVPDA